MGIFVYQGDEEGCGLATLKMLLLDLTKKKGYRYLTSEKEGDILARYRRLGTLARTPLFRTGGVWDLCYCNQDTPGFDLDHCTAFMRYNGTEAMIVLCNFGPGVVSTDLIIPQELRELASIDKTEATLLAPAYGYALLKCK